MTRCLVFCAVIALATVSATAQTPGAGTNPLTSALKTQFDAIKRNIVEASEKMPDEHYGFKPTPEVRSFAELIGHLANANYLFCARVKGEKNPNDGNDFEKRTAKADLVKALKDAVAYCDTAYGVTDAVAMEMMTTGQAPNQRQVPKANFLVSNVAHDNEHYGNIVTYMRLKGLVPPSTERAQQMQRPSGE
jgi:uncharacterized damage-inducible protein DinB